MSCSLYFLVITSIHLTSFFHLIISSITLANSMGWEVLICSTVHRVTTWAWFVGVASCICSLIIEWINYSHFSKFLQLPVARARICHPMKLQKVLNSALWLVHVIDALVAKIEVARTLETFCKSFNKISFPHCSPTSFSSFASTLSLSALTPPPPSPSLSGTSERAVQKTPSSQRWIPPTAREPLTPNELVFRKVRGWVSQSVSWGIHLFSGLSVYSRTFLSDQDTLLCPYFLFLK